MGYVASVKMLLFLPQKKTKTCGTIKCKNSRQRKLAKNVWDKMSPEERRAIRKKKNQAQRVIKKDVKEWVLSKCPDCHGKEEHLFEYGWSGVGMPWIRCEKCKKKYLKMPAIYRTEESRSPIIINEVSFT